MSAMSRRRVFVPACLTLALVIALGATTADARIRHHGQSSSTQANPTTSHSSSGDASNGDAGAKATKEHVKAASDDVDKILDNKIRNICRGC